MYRNMHNIPKKDSSTNIYSPGFRGHAHIECNSWVTIACCAPSPQHGPPCPLSSPDLKVSHPTLSTDSVYKVVVGRQMLLKTATDIT